MIFEWRTYRFAPGRAAAYLAAFQSEGLPLVTRHLPLLGYWMTESGRLNVLHHLWVYADLDDRAACRASLSADADWTARTSGLERFVRHGPGFVVSFGGHQ